MTDFYIREESDFADYKSDQNVIIKQKYLKYILRSTYEEADPPPEFPGLRWYPFVNSYYQHSEDVDVVSRVNSLLEFKSSLDSFATIENLSSEFINEDPYYERNAHLKYLTAKPVSFIILGKPGVGEEELGKLLADHWKCVYIEPHMLIREEIESGSRAGQCIEFNLRCGRAIGVDVMLRLLEKRVKSKSAGHRGFVICSFPLVPNNLFEADPVSTESAVFNVQEIFEDVFEKTLATAVDPVETNVVKTRDAGKKKRNVSEEEDEEEEEEEEEEEDGEEEESIKTEKTVILPPKDDVPLDVGSIYGDICSADNIGNDIEAQLNFLRQMLEHPFLIIYVACSNTDVVSKHDQNRFDIYSSQVIDMLKTTSEKMVYTLFSRVPGVQQEGLREDLFDTGPSVDTSRLKHLVKLPRDFVINVVAQLDQYRRHALPVIERFILLHDPQYVIRVDGRTTSERMFNIIKPKLRVLPVQRVILPEKMLVPLETFGGEGGQDAEPNFEDLSPEEAFDKLRKRLAASPMFKWTWSNWGTKCPVSMKEGNYLDGTTKFSVHFLNKIFFLADEDAYLKFYRNPRPYLVSPYPKPSCRIFVVGPPCCGKTAVARCIAYLLDGEVLDPHKIKANFIRQRENEYKEQIRFAAINSAIAILNEKRKEEMAHKKAWRERSVAELFEKQSELLKKRIALDATKPVKKPETFHLEEYSSFPVKATINLKDAESSHMAIATSEFKIFARKMDQMRANFELYALPCFDDIEKCDYLLRRPEMLEEYLPENLQPIDYTVEAATVFDDFVRDYADAAVTNSKVDDIEMTLENTYEMYVNAIAAIEDRNKAQGKNRGGWIIDGMTLNLELIEQIIPDYFADEIVVLKDDSSHQHLLHKYAVQDEHYYGNFRNLFLEMGKPDAAWRSPSVLSTDSHKMEIARGVVFDILDKSNFPYEKHEEGDEPDSGTRNRSSSVKHYKTELDHFEEGWERLKHLIERLNVSARVIDVYVTGKSIEEILKEVVHSIDDQYRRQATIMTPEDRTEELEDFGGPMVQEEAGAEEAEEEHGVAEDVFFQNRRFGDTYNYCPVTFHEHWVLWRGKEEHGVKYEDKVYLTCNEHALKLFVANPKKYLIKTASPKSFPPPRICIVGPSGSGKTVLAKRLSRNLGIFYRNYEKLLVDLIAPRSKKKLVEVLNSREAGVDGNVIQNYVASDTPLPEEFLDKIVPKIWFVEPIRTTGFVFDGFPMRPSDADYMESRLAIPDVILELSISDEVLHARLIQKLLDEWQIKADQENELRNRDNLLELHTWEEQRQARLEELVDAKRQARYAARIREKTAQSTPAETSGQSRPYLEDLKEEDEEMDSPSSVKTKSQISIDSIAEQADYEDALKILEEEFPEVVVEENVETFEEAAERISNEIENTYVADSEFIRLLREYCDAEQIPWKTIDANMDEDKVFAQAMHVVDPFKFRNNSLFERCYDITVEMSEKLLSSGYYFLSKFGRTCPVQYFDGKINIQMFLPAEQKFSLFPIIHRQYIYYLNGAVNRAKFKCDPLKYVSQKLVNFPLIPVKIAIIGPPKTGKTTLAERFKRDFGLRHISRGRAAHYVFKYIEHSELAVKMDLILRKGLQLPQEMVIKCVEAMTYDARSVTQGIVLDGFPNNSTEVRFLGEIGMIPHLVIDLQATEANIWEFLGSDVKKGKFPVFSRKFVDHRCKQWAPGEKGFREWMTQQYQNLATVTLDNCKWGVWTAACELVLPVLASIQNYYKKAGTDVALPLEHLLITPMEFNERKGRNFQNYCPGCLYHHNVLTQSRSPPDRKELVQFEKYFYWVCPQHLDEFLATPEKLLPPNNPNTLPTDLPKRIFLVENPDDSAEDGLCLICFWENKPARVLNQGSYEYAVWYKDTIYLFDTLECLMKFLKQPHLFYDITINYKDSKPYPPLKYNELPTLGLLEQYEARQIIKAVTNTGILRPVIPGLSTSVSASINTGLYLKLYNPRTPEKYVGMYRESETKIKLMRLGLLDNLARMKKQINPYLYYEEAVPQFDDPLKLSSVKVDTSVGSSKYSDVGVGIINEVLDKMSFS